MVVGVTQHEDMLSGSRGKWGHHLSTEQDLPIFTHTFTSVHISLGFRQVQLKQDKKHGKQKDGPLSFVSSSASLFACQEQCIWQRLLPRYLQSWQSLLEYRHPKTGSEPPSEVHRCFCWESHQWGVHCGVTTAEEEWKQEKQLQPSCKCTQPCPLLYYHLMSLASALSAPSSVSSQ